MGLGNLCGARIQFRNLIAQAAQLLCYLKIFPVSRRSHKMFLYTALASEAALNAAIARRGIACF
jgi:hypothetical protein